MIVEVEGQEYEFPDSMSQEEVLAVLRQKFPPKQAESPERGFIPSVGDAVAGAVRGAGSIGATLLAPYDIASDYAAGRGLTLQGNRERRAAMDSALTTLGADTESTAFKGGKIGTEIAGTLPIGGLLGKVLGKAGASAPVVSAIESGGFSLGRPGATTVLGKAGDLATRTLGGAVTGGTQMGLIDPSQAGEGAVIGGLLPGSVKVAGTIGKALGKGAGIAGANILGATTGTGAEAVTTAFKAGKDKAVAFLENMRGNVGFDEIVDSAKQAVSSLRTARQQQ